MEEEFCENCKSTITYMWSRYYELRDKGLLKESQVIKKDVLNFINWGTLHTNDSCECRKVLTKKVA